MQSCNVRSVEFGRDDLAGVGKGSTTRSVGVSVSEFIRLLIVIFTNKLNISDHTSYVGFYDTVTDGEDVITMLIYMCFDLSRYLNISQ